MLYAKYGLRCTEATVGLPNYVHEFKLSSTMYIYIYIIKFSWY